MKIKKPWVSWEEFEAIVGGNWTPGAHTHVKADITDWGDWIDQAVKQASSPTFVTAKLSALTDGYVPYHVDDATGLANSPIFTDGTKVGIGVVPVARLAVLSTAISVATAQKASGFIYMDISAGNQTNGLWFEGEITGDMFFGHKEGSDDLVISRAGGDTTELVRFKYDGKVGIGTPAPGVICHVYGDGGNYGAYGTPLRVEAVNYTYMELLGKNNQAGILYNRDGSIGWFTGLNASGNFRIADMATINQAGVTGAKDGTEGITVDTSGKVGIGTITPGVLLDVLGGAGSWGRFGDGTGYVTISGSGAGSWEKISATHRLYFDTAAGTMVTFTDAGKVGIGTTGPNTTLEVAAGASPRIAVTDGAGVNRRALVLAFDAANYAEIFAYKYGAGIGPKDLIFPYGNVGIGVVDPDVKLEVNGIVKADNFYLAAGVTPNLGWLSDVELGSLEEGETIRYHQATMKFIDAWGIDYDNPRLVYKIYTEFFQDDPTLNDPWTGAAIGIGTRTSIDGEANHPGIVRFMSQAALGTGYKFMTDVNCMIIGGAEHSEFIFKTPADMTNIVVRMGFCDVPALGACVDGVYLELIGDELDGRTRNNSAGGSTATHFHVAANTWYRGKLAVNSNATLVTYALYTCTDGIIRWTDTLAANIPTARVTGHGVSGAVAPNDPKHIIDIDMMIATRAGYITR